MYAPATSTKLPHRYRIKTAGTVLLSHSNIDPAGVILDECRIVFASIGESQPKPVHNPTLTEDHSTVMLRVVAASMLVRVNMDSAYCDCAQHGTRRMTEWMTSGGCGG